MSLQNGLQKLLNFAQTYQIVKAHNAKYEKGEVSFALVLNSRAILSLEEKRAYMNGLAFNKEESDKYKLKIDAVEGRSDGETEGLGMFRPLPENLDYRKLGYVTEVVEQGK